MSRAVITHPDGSVTTVQSTSGCAQGCSWVFWVVLIVYVVALPAESFPLWGAICAYILEAAITAAAVAGWLQRRQAKPPRAA